MADLPADLRHALDVVGSAVPATVLTATTKRLIGRYRDGGAERGPILKSATDATAYATYRMPATFAATWSALRQLASLDREFAPATQLDLGGGTGAAVWAAAMVWPTLQQVTVVETSPEVIKTGRRIAGLADAAAVRDATWICAGIRTNLPVTDLVTVSYLLGELPPAERDELVARLARHGGVVALVEPGTPAGYERIVTARDQLLAAGLTLHAPCPHDRTCPIPRERDWCHFSARINRSSLHRRTKTGSRSFEDEKFSYVIASRQPGRRAANRVLRHPMYSKGLVSLRLCTGADELADIVVAKRHDSYRAARDVGWGDAWPPPGG